MKLFSRKPVWRDRNGSIVCKGNACTKECDNRCPIWLNTVALQFLQKGDADRAIVLLTDAIEIAPDFPDLYNNLGSAYGMNNQHEAAHQAFVAAYRMKPKYMAALLGMIVSEKNLGMYTEAVQHCKEYEDWGGDGSELRKSIREALEADKVAEKEKKKFAGTEIEGKKLGIIGLGAIGGKVANAAIHLGMEVYGYDPYVSVDAAWNLSRSVKHCLHVEEIYEECDFITIHVPALPQTKGTINADAISLMKDGVIILNFARDVLCNEEDILDGIASGKIRKYVTDFPNTTTAGKEGCIVIPHLGASTEESEDNCAVMAVKELKNYLENGNIINSVNFPSCDMGVCTQAGRVGIFHKNIANMITKFTACFGDEGINITDMMNKSRGEFAYTMLDLEQPAQKAMIEKLESIEGVVRVRVVK